MRVCAHTRVCTTGSFQNPQPLGPVGMQTCPWGMACSLFSINQRSLRKRLGPAAPPRLPPAQTTARGRDPAPAVRAAALGSALATLPLRQLPPLQMAETRLGEMKVVENPAVMEKYLRVGRRDCGPRVVITPRSPEMQPLPAVNDDFVG